MLDKGHNIWTKSRVVVDKYIPQSHKSNQNDFLSPDNILICNIQTDTTIE